MTIAASVPKKDGQDISASLYNACATSARRTLARAHQIFGQEITAAGYAARVEDASQWPIARDDDVPDRLVLYFTGTLKLAALAL